MKKRFFTTAILVTSCLFVLSLPLNARSKTAASSSTEPLSVMENALNAASGENSPSPYTMNADTKTCRLACATTVFSQPDVRFMHKLKASDNDAKIVVKNLPKGLVYNPTRRLVEGKIKREGVYHYTVTVSNREMKTDEIVTLTVSSKLSQPIPFMGWLSWNCFEGNVCEANVLGVANAFVELGLPQYGYRYICLDDLWHASERRANGKPQYSTTKFPHGLTYLTDSVHRLNMRIGIYSDAAKTTCAGAFGSFGYEQIDAHQYAEWGFDLLKYDACGTDALSSKELAARYKTMGDALKESGRNLLFYLCEWGSRSPWLWGSESGGTCWRTTYDSRDTWDHGRHDSGHCGVVQGIDILRNLSYYSGVNRFNDGDMMMIGLWGTGKSSNANNASGMNATEYRSQFSMWCMFSSPLTLCNDVRFWADPSALAFSRLSDQKQELIASNIANDLEIITNEEMIAINQDRMGQAALLVKKEGNLEYYAKDLENGDIAIAVLNRGTTTEKTNVLMKDYEALKPNKKYVVRDLWKHCNVDSTDTSFDVNVSAHETCVFRITPLRKK